MTHNTKLWFKRKNYGWGWQPSTKEGWLVILAYVLLLILITTQEYNVNDWFEVILKIVVPSVLLTIGLIFVCYKKGEKPRWEWGRRD